MFKYEEQQKAQIFWEC